MLGGELLFEPLERAPYAFDGSLYEIDPLGVIVPRTESDVRAVLAYAAEHSISIHPRGAGTGLAGESLGRGLILDLSRHFRRIVETRAETVVVQAGVVLDVLNAHLAPLGRRIGPDPSGSNAATIGGLIAGDSTGAHSLKQGTFGDILESVRVIFSNGETAELGPVGPPDPNREPENFLDSVARRVWAIGQRNADLIAKKKPRSPRNRCGYALEAAFRKPGFADLARLIAGSEGTLAVILEATLRTVPIPTARAGVFLPFARLADAADAVLDCLKDAPSACEFIDRRSLHFAKDAEPALFESIPADIEAALIVEFEGNDAFEAARAALGLSKRMEASGRLIGPSIVADRHADCDRLLSLRDRVRPYLLRMKGPQRAVPVIEDIALPPEELNAFLAKLQRILKANDLNWVLNGHFGHGQLHIRPFLNIADSLDIAKLEPLAAEIYETVLEHGGTISGEHGCGLARSQFVRKQYGELTTIFSELKYTFDPLGLLNPGKIVAEDPHLMTRDLKSVPTISPATGRLGSLPLLEAPLRWPDRSREEQILACNGCGACRSFEPSLRMCPSFRGTRAEASTPKALTNLLRQIGADTLDPNLWGTEELKNIAGLCVHCHLCEHECPAGIDVSSLMLEVKAAHVERHGLSAVDWVFARVEVWSALASKYPLLWNAVLGSRTGRALVERFFGLSRHRRLPRAQRRSFLKRAEKLGLTTPRPQDSRPRVAYFVDVFANDFDQELAETVVDVLQYSGVNVYVPKRQRGCGMPALVAGDLEHARELAASNLKVLGEAVRDGYTVICSEPTAALMIRLEYPKLTDDLDAALVAQNTMDVGAYLSGLFARGQMPQPQVVLNARVGYHQPCHLRALNVGSPGLDLIRTIPGLDVEFIDRGCSGIAGTFGLARKNFRASLRSGRDLRRRLKDPDLDLGSTECGTCRLQMEQGISKRTLHPVKLLAMGLGLTPSLRQSLKRPRESSINEPVED